ncbi:MAG TPA: DUF4129 domain-containing protein [Gemmatimonadales bacterium]|nr:DUF4129 domain-containing protein [Gemmatimonadales bacterium]
MQGIPVDSVRRAVAEVFARPTYRWTTGRSPLEWMVEQLGRFLDWLARAEASHPAVFQVLLGVLVAMLLGVLAHMGYVVWRITRPTVQTAARVAGATGLRLEDARAHRERAERLAREGRYAEALAHRFIAMLLDLDRDEALKFDPSKTPAEYVGEARLDAAGRASLGALVARLYGHLFGAAPCDERTYREFASQADLLHEHVASG